MMPVQDYPVLPDNRASDEGRSGCHNRPPMKMTLMVQDGWTEDGRRKMVEIPFVMSPDCKHDTPETSPRCAGCIHMRKTTC